MLTIYDVYFAVNGGRVHAWANNAEWRIDGDTLVRKLDSRGANDRSYTVH